MKEEKFYNKRIIEPDYLQVKLLNGATITIRPLTLAERKYCISLAEKLNLNDSTSFANSYIKWQGDIIYYIITRTNKDFSREDVDNLLDNSVIEQIVKYALKDPFSELFDVK